MFTTLNYQIHQNDWSFGFLIFQLLKVYKVQTRIININFYQEITYICLFLFYNFNINQLFIIYLATQEMDINENVHD